MSFEWISAILLWWGNLIAKPYAIWVVMENLVGLSVVTAIVTAILLGFFWNPRKTPYGDEWDDKWGVPILIILCSLSPPVLSVAILSVLPIIFIFCACLATLLGIYYGISRIRSR